MSWNARSLGLSVISLGLFVAACSDDKSSPSEKTFEITSPSFKSGDEIPDQFTCEGKPFGEGISPALNWTAGPASTKTYALVFKDTSLSELNPPDDHGYHWAVWNIPKDTRSLPEGMGADQYPASPAGSEQYSGYPGRPYQFLGPCPSWAATKSGAPLSHDTYSFTLYAIAADPLDPPAQDPNANYVHPLDDYLKSIAIAKAELIVTSDAQPSEVPF
jgi:phosphatidylethanolamine-binding protein (PEBP) family uncharacterized protein